MPRASRRQARCTCGSARAQASSSGNRSTKFGLSRKLRVRTSAASYDRSSGSSITRRSVPGPTCHYLQRRGPRPKGVEEGPAAHAHLQVPTFGEVAQHPVRLRHRERGLYRRPRGSELTPLSQSPEQLLLLDFHRGRPDPALVRSSDAPNQQPEGREGDPTVRSENPPEVRN